MPRSPKDNQEIRDARREEILQAAARVFADKGLAHAKISDIASAAGLSHGLVYHYFDSKDAIFEAIVEHMIARIRADMDADPELPPFERIVAAVERARIKACQGGVEAGRVVAQAMLQGSIPEEIKQRLASHFRDMHREVTDRIRAAQGEGSVDGSIDPEELAAALICLMRGMTMRMPDVPSFTLPATDTVLRLLRPAKTPQESRRPRTRAARGAHVTRSRRS